LSRIKTLRELESRLVSFLDEALALKQERLGVLDGLNRLDDITREAILGKSMTDEIGDWFAAHNDWPESDRLRPADRNRLQLMLGQLQREIHASSDSSAATRKISGEIGRWAKPLEDSAEKSASRKIVLKRPPESADPDLKDDTIPLYRKTIDGVVELFNELSTDKQHLLSVLDESLDEAQKKGSKEALLLSAFTIYYLKHNGYMVEPYVRRLKEVESALKGSDRDA